MSLSTDDVRKVWTTDGIVKNPNPATNEATPFIAPATGLNSIEIVVRRLEQKVDALAAALAALTAQKES